MLKWIIFGVMTVFGIVLIVAIAQPEKKSAAQSAKYDQFMRECATKNSHHANVLRSCERNARNKGY